MILARKKLTEGIQIIGSFDMAACEQIFNYKRFISKKNKEDKNIV